MSKFYEVTDPEALKAFSNKAVTTVHKYNNGLILRLLRDCDVVPGVKRLGSTADIEQAAVQEATLPGVQNTPEA